MRRVALVVIAALGLGAHCPPHGKPPWYGPVEALGFSPLRTPTTDLGPGWIIRKSDQEPFLTQCFTGTVTKGNSFESYTDTQQVSTQAQAKTTLGKYANAIANFSMIKKLEVVFTGLRTDSIVDIVPNLTIPECYALRLSEMENIKALLSLNTIRIKVVAQTAADAKVAIEGIKSRIGNIDASVSTSITADDEIEIAGSALYVGYRPFKSMLQYDQARATLHQSEAARLGKLMQVPGGDYTVTVGSIQDGKVSLQITSVNPAIAPASAGVTLGKNEAVDIKKSDRFGAVIVALAVESDSATVLVQEWAMPIGFQ